MKSNKHIISLTENNNMEEDKEYKDAMFALNFSRQPIPFSNIEKTTIEIETGHLPDQFFFDIAVLIDKYEAQRLLPAKAKRDS